MIKIYTKSYKIQATKNVTFYSVQITEITKLFVIYFKKREKMRKQLLLKVFPRKEFVEGIINNNREATSLVSYSLISSCFTFIECLVMSTINHRKKGSKKFLSIAFVCVVVVFFSIIIIIIIIDNFSPFYSRTEKKKIWSKINCQLFFLHQIFVRLLSLTIVKCCKLSHFPICTVWNTLL